MPDKREDQKRNAGIDRERKKRPSERNLERNRAGNAGTRTRQARNARIKRKRKKQIMRRCVMGISLALVLILVAVAIKMLFFSNKEGVPEQKTEKSDASDDKTENKGVDTENDAPVITLTESGTLAVRLGEGYTEPGYTAVDSQGRDITERVQVDLSGLDYAGQQKIVYSVEDQEGRTTSVSRDIEVTPNTEYETPGLAICMYHYVYDSSQPPEDLNNNYISTDTLAEEMAYLHENGYYFPTWQEVREYVDGKRKLPDKSIVLTFDDGPNYMHLGTPILEQYQTPATSFVIARYWDTREMLYGYSSEYLSFESHSYGMHQGGGNQGHGGIYTAMSPEEVLEDLQKSFDICGNHNAFAYPFGDYTTEGCQTLEEAGLLCAVTTENGKCYPGDNPYLLPRVRMLGSQSLSEFIASIQ